MLPSVLLFVSFRFSLVFTFHRSRLWLGSALALLVATVALTAAPETRLYQEMPAEEVIAALGKPQSTARMGDREILQFAGGIRIELRDGKLHQARGIVVDLRAPSGSQAAAAAANPPPPGVTPTSTATSPPEKPTVADSPDLNSPPANPSKSTETTQPSTSSTTQSPESASDESVESRVEEGEEMSWEAYLEELEAEEPVSDGTSQLIEFILITLITGGLIRWGFARAGMPILFKPLSLIVACYVAVAGLLRIVPWAAETREQFHFNDLLLLITLYVLVKIFSDAREDITILKIVVGTIIAARIFGFVFVLLGLFLLGQLG